MWKFEVFKDPEGDWRWRLVALNTLIVFESSERFQRRVDARNAAVKARDAIGNAVIVDV